MKTLLSFISLLLLTACSVGPRAARPNQKVEVFIADWCPHCKRLEAYLTENGVHYIRRDVEKDPGAKKQLIKYGGRGIPLTVINGRTILQGFDRSLLCYELKIC